MLIKYIGGRTRYKVSPNRTAYYFTPENNRTLDIKDQNIINYIFSLPNRAEFQAVENIEVEEKKSVVADVIETVNDIVKKKAGRPKKEK